MRNLPTPALLFWASMIMPSASAATITFDLTCVVNGLATHQCAAPVGSFGTVTLEDIGTNTIGVSVSLVNPDQKFRDLLLNFNPGLSLLLSNDGDANNTVSLSPNGFSIQPYTGMFDIGGSGGQGWAGDSGYSTVLTFSGAVTVSDFAFEDSLGNLAVAIHIQNIGSQSGGTCSGSDDGTTPCDPTQTGQGSLKIGGANPTPGDVTDVPEPGTLSLIGLALLGAASVYRQRLRP